MPTLYVTEVGARLEKEYGRLLVTKEDDVLLRVPLERVSQVVLVGHVGVTTPALHALLQQEVPLLLVSRTGRLKGRLLPPTAPNLPLRQAQHRRNDDEEFSLALSRTLVAGKVRNQRTLALRITRRRPDIDRTALTEMKSLLARAQRARDLDTLRGIEGQAARLYFSVYRQSFADHWQFTRRSRRPPKDPVNALLSLGYTFLVQNMMAALETAGLDPFLGFFHTEKYGRPALALDLVEEFRAPVVDSLTLTLLNHRLLRARDFESSRADEGVLLTQRGMRVFLKQYTRRLESVFKSRSLGRRISYRKLFEVQARRLARMVQSDGMDYRPFRLR